jgi:hypothetical protein
VFAIHGDKDEIYFLTTVEIAKAQKKDQELKIYYKKNVKTPEKDMHFQQFYGTGQSVGITTTFSTLATHISKRQ